MSAVEARLRAMGLEIPPVPKPGGKYVSAARAENLLILSGVIGTAYQDGRWSLPLKGKVGSDLSIEQGYASARLCALNHIATMKQELGDLGRVKKIVKLVGYVNAAPGFTKAPLVLDGASDLLVSAFGDEIGLHARVAVYQHEMSFNAPVETELTVWVG